MDMIRWLASNIVVQVAWGLGLLAVLLAFLFGGSKSAEEQVVAESSNAVAEKVVTAEAAVEPTVKAAAVAAVAAVASTVEKEAEPVQAVVETSAEAVVTETPATEEAVVEAKTEEVVEAPAVETAAVESDAAAPATEEVLAVEEATLDTSNVADKSSEDVLVMAREAYWNNGLDEAAELYGVLIEREPTVIEHKGELGNVLWRQGYPKKAAELYADIAAPMIEKGNGERVSNMVGFIGLFFPERAATIRELLASN